MLTICCVPQHLEQRRAAAAATTIYCSPARLGVAHYPTRAAPPHAGTPSMVLGPPPGLSRSADHPHDSSSGSSSSAAIDATGWWVSAPRPQPAPWQCHYCYFENMGVHECCTMCGRASCVVSGATAHTTSDSLLGGLASAVSSAWSHAASFVTGGGGSSYKAALERPPPLQHFDNYHRSNTSSSSGSYAGNADHSTNSYSHGPQGHRSNCSSSADHSQTLTNSVNNNGGQYISQPQPSFHETQSNHHSYADSQGRYQPVFGGNQYMTDDYRSFLNGMDSVPGAVNGKISSSSSSGRSTSSSRNSSNSSSSCVVHNATPEPASVLDHRTATQIALDEDLQRIRAASAQRYRNSRTYHSGTGNYSGHGTASLMGGGALYSGNAKWY